MSNEKFPLFSVIIPVYNAEKYLTETIESVIAQDISFERNIEIVLVNDGSTDNSEATCKEYKKKYPYNITYIKQKNAGVSAARNAGIDAAKGKYLAFLDSDDRYSKDVARKVYDFFEEHYDEVDVVAVKLVFFDAKTGDHMLNYKFTNTRIIDTESEPDCVQLSGGSAFIKRKAIQGRYYFDQRIKFSEDSKLLTEIILDKSKYGVIKEPILYYRRRQEQNSAINTSMQEKGWYFDTTKHVYTYLLDYSRKKLGYDSRYVQHLVMYDLQWRLRQPRQVVLNFEEEKQYKQIIFNLLKQIDDDIIMAQRWLPLEYKIFALKKKYGRTYERKISTKNGAVHINNTLIWDYSRSPQYFKVEFVSVSKDRSEVKLEGLVAAPATTKCQVFVEVDGKTIPTTPVPRKHTVTTFLGDTVTGGYGFEVFVPIRDGSRICGILQFSDGCKVVMPLNLRYHSRIGNINYAYRHQDGYILSKREDYIRLAEYNTQRHLYAELRFWIKIFTDALLAKGSKRYLGSKSTGANIGSFKKMSIFLKELAAYGKRAILAIRVKGLRCYIKGLWRAVWIVGGRVAYHFTRLIIHQEIWIISDRVNAAGDNGEAFFRFLQSQNNPNIRPFFAIAKTSPDYKKMQAIGRVIDRNGLKYKLLFLLSSRVISSHADEFVINPFTRNEEYFVGMLRFKFVFLQHGITKDDISGWLNKYRKNIGLFVTAARPEYASIINGDYHYSKDRLSLSGFPRYDQLVDSQQKRLIIMPTWRKFIAVKADKKSGQRLYDSMFKKSDFYKFYQNLIDDKRIKGALSSADMTAEFYLHPSHQLQISDFKGNKLVRIMDFPFDYKAAFREGSLLVTDYSSVAFDFAYMKKPVVYAQFDEAIFFGSHWERGYFSYDKHGFGPVRRDYEATVKEIVKIIEGNCQMENKYKKRVDNFFAYTDKKNSERVYKAILDMPK